jgi:dTDP-glucose 4,6-dehydratase
MRLLVTGAAGFIGSNFVRHVLAERPGWAIVALDKLTYAGNLENLADVTRSHADRLLFVRGDICDGALVEEIFAAQGFQAVVNFAAESHVDRSIHDPDAFLQTNVIGTNVLLAAARRRWAAGGGGFAPDVKFVQVSTDEVYGSLGATGLFTERTPLDPHSPYAASKASADLVAKAYVDTYGLPVCITRCSNNYGAYQFPEKLIPLMIRNALRHEPLPVYGDGQQVRDWLHVDDHCRAIELVLAQGQPGEVYNVGGDNERANLELVRLILTTLRAMTGDPGIDEGLIRHVKDRLGHDRRYGIDATKIRTQLGWAPRVSFEDGLARTLAWYLDHRDWTERVISGEYLRFYEANYGAT